jgi:hypothetical protein
MKSMVIIAITGLALITSTEVDGGELFKDRETSLSIFGGWVDKDDSKFAPGIGITHFLTPHWGFGAMTHWDNYDGTFIDNVSGEGYFRYPLRGMSLAPYAVASIGYSFETDETFESIGGGVEWRFHKSWGAFGDVRWQINNDTDDGVAVRLGVKLLF